MPLAIKQKSLFQAGTHLVILVSSGPWTHFCPSPPYVPSAGFSLPLNFALM